jgi:glycosyltransferase involved in cell wall biosynthesis
LAERSGSALLSYSYYGYSAFTACRADVPKILFQLHPHPVSVRRILRKELELHPECAGTLRKEWELALPEEDFRRIATEPSMAGHWLAASSFTRQTLVENGVPEERVHIVPYGINASQQHASQPSGSPRRRSNGKLQLLFVGRINQRKGIKYLLEALDMLDSQQVELTVCGWAEDGLELFRAYEGRVTVRPSVSAAELEQAYASADLFILPSVAEGFGQVLLEAMAAGLPIAATTRTAAPDLIRHGVEGLVFEPASAEAAAGSIAWALDNRLRLPEMGRAAQARSKEFTWERFRSGIAGIVAGILQGPRAQAGHSEVKQYVHL